MRLVCPVCGRDNPDGTILCAGCGHRLIGDTNMLVEREAEERVTCPRCETINKPGSVNCHRCGYYFSTRPFPDNNWAWPAFPAPPHFLLNGSGRETADMAESAAYPAAHDQLHVSIHLLLDTQEIIDLQGAVEYTIGRGDQQDGWEPAVDLTPHGGEAGGVSRRHARIFIEDGQPYIEDVGSMNGTFINTVRLITRVPQPLRDGDRLQFGRVLVQLRIRSSIPETGSGSRK